MLHTYYTIRALANEWQTLLPGYEVVDAFSQTRNELTIALARGDAGCMLRWSVDPSFLYIFRSEGISRKKRNVATLFEPAFGRRVEQVRVADRDRMLYMDFKGGGGFVGALFGARANIFLVDSDEVVMEAFRSSEKNEDRPALQPRVAPRMESFEVFEQRWRTNRSTIAKAVQATFPLFDRVLAEEVVHISGVPDRAPAECSRAERKALFQAGMDIIRKLQEGGRQPRMYGSEKHPEAFSLFPLSSQNDERERFDTVDAAVRTFVRRSLARRHFDALYNPIGEALTQARDHSRRSLRQMQETLSQPSRAERHEQYGHLLMAAPNDVPPGAEEVTLPDLFGDAEDVIIPLAPALSAIENAQRYYDKARRTRRSREEAEGRLKATEAKAKEADELLERLQQLDTVYALKQFRKNEAERLAPFVGAKDEALDRIPFRRFPLANGYEVWVGRNARQNDDLTFHHARKYDYWLHAGGVAGSHAVLRLPNRNAQPDKRLLHQTASIAAYYSKARGQSLAPVMIALKKHVRSPKGGPPGAVYVEHEEVVMVEPRKPAS